MSVPRTRLSCPPRPASGWASLTETEREVAELVARGLTNRELGDRMFLSPHTVAFHLRRTYRKLDIASRVEPTRLVPTRNARGPEPRQGGTRTAAERALEALRAEAEGLRRARASRASIEQAKGALVALGGWDPDEVWARLVRISQHTDTKVREVAQSLLDAAAQDGHRPRPDIAAAVRAELTLSAPPPDGTEPRDG